MAKNKRIVNVIELSDNTVLGVNTFVVPDGVEPHSKEEQKTVDLAEKLFNEMAQANGMDKDDLEDCLDNGYFEEGTYKVVIHWSN
jgi:hypothetical protein